MVDTKNHRDDPQADAQRQHPAQAENRRFEASEYKRLRLSH
jgi:hypothetical protein